MERFCKPVVGNAVHDAFGDCSGGAGGWGWETGWGRSGDECGAPGVGGEHYIITVLEKRAPSPRRRNRGSVTMRGNSMRVRIIRYFRPLYTLRQNGLFELIKIPAREKPYSYYI